MKQPTPTIDLVSWNEAAQGCLAAICTDTLGAEMTPATEEAVVDRLCGSLIAVVSDNNAAYIGLSSSHDGCRRLAAAMMGMEPGDAADLSDDDLRDALGELVNVLVGMMKTRLCGSDNSLNLGLPLFIDGAVTPERHSKVLRSVYDVGGTCCILTVVSPRVAMRSAA